MVEISLQDRDNEIRSMKIVVFVAERRKKISREK